MSPPQSIRHQARVYHNEQYILPVDTEEKKRLNGQHKNIVAGYDNRLILADYTPKAGDRILDSGTGTGAWPVDVANISPSETEIWGIDIEERIFPTGPPAERIRYIQKSIVEIPSEWFGTFDFVHQRLLTGALLAKQWPVSISNIYNLLKPGGFAQLGEFGYMKGGPIMDRFKIMFDGVSAQRGLLRDSAVQIPTLLNSAGFSNIQIFRKDFPVGGWAGEAGKTALILWTMLAKAVKTPVLNAGGFGVVSSEAEFDQLIEDLDKECDTTKGCCVEFVYITAQK